jgi:hypothetical protein
MAIALNLLDPELVVVGGPLVHDDGILVEAVRREVRMRALPHISRHIRIETDDQGAMSGARGAALLALDCIFDSTDALVEMLTWIGADVAPVIRRVQPRQRSPRTGTVRTASSPYCSSPGGSRERRFAGRLNLLRAGMGNAGSRRRTVWAGFLARHRAWRNPTSRIRGTGIGRQAAFPGMAALDR